MDIYNLFPGGWASNCYILISDGHAAVVDPSASAEKIIDFIKSKGARLDFIILTHGHFDHLLSLDELRELTNAPAYIHEYDSEMLTDGEKNAYTIFFGKDQAYKPAEKTLKNGDTLTLGGEKLEIIATPGHSKGSMCILNRESKILITGDTLFSSGYGRCDLYGGNASTLARSLLSLRELDESLTIYPGHGYTEKLGAALDTLYFM